MTYRSKIYLYIIYILLFDYTHLEMEIILNNNCNLNKLIFLYNMQNNEKIKKICNCNNFFFLLLSFEKFFSFNIYLKIIKLLTMITEEISF